MADPFDVPDLEPLEEPGKAADPLAPEADPFDVPDIVDAPAPARQAGTGNMALDGLLGLAEGMTLNNAGEIGSVGSKLGTLLADAAQPTRERDGLPPTYAGSRGVDADELVKRGMETGAGKTGYVAGLAAPAVASGFAAPAAVGAQAAVGAGAGALAAGGESGYDPLATLVGAGTGAALAGAGGAIAGHLGGRATLAGVPSVGTRAEQLLEGLASSTRKLGAQAGVGAGIGAVTSGSTNPMEVLKGAGKGAATAAALGKLGGAAPKAAPYLAPAARALGSSAAPLGGMFAGRASKARAQEADVAYGTAPTMHWAVQSVLTSGDTGLEPADEQRLTEAVMSGDEDKVISANFALQQRSPMYAARLRRELESLQEEN